MKLIKEEHLLGCFCDSLVNLSTVGAFQIVESAIVELMGILHIDGVTCIRNYNAIWVFTRNRIEFKHKLHWRDAYVLECYISSIGNAKLEIDTIIRKGNTIILVARTTLCALDLSTGKIRRCNDVGVISELRTETPEFDVAFNNMNFVPGDLIDSVVAHSTDIDYCQHTNNITYIRHVLNQYSKQQMIEHPINAIEIQYINQTFENDKLDIYQCDNNSYSIQCNSKVVANCVIEFKK